MKRNRRNAPRLLPKLAAVCGLLLVAGSVTPAQGWNQNPQPNANNQPSSAAPGGPAFTPPEAGLSQEELQQLAAEANAANNIESPNPNSLQQGRIDLLKLLRDGGWLMLPIALMSLLVVAFTIERFFAIRRGRVFPRRLRRELRFVAEDTATPPAPASLYEASERYPSAAARILRDALAKIGRPVTEMEAAIDQATQREADRLYANVRWLTLAAAVTPLIGLLGTVWGMIIAFYNTTQLGAGSNKAEYLAGGIYVALVTTLGGLAVAIPAAIFAHYFEGRISKLMAQIDAEIKRIVPRFEHLEGKARYDLNARGLTRRPHANQPHTHSSNEIPTVPTLTPPPVRPAASRTN